MEVSSDMFLSILILLQNSLPCTENFYRYQKNFEKYVGADGEEKPAGTDGTVKTIASPRMMSNSPLASLAKQHGINFNPSGTKNMMRFAANKEAGATEGAEENKGEEGKDGEFSTGTLKSAKQVQADKKARATEMAQMVAEGKDVVNQDDAAALRLPNATKRPAAMTLTTDPNAPTQQMVMSPTSFLTG